MVTRFVSLFVVAAFSAGFVFAKDIEGQDERGKTQAGTVSSGIEVRTKSEKKDSIPEVAQLFADNVSLKDSKKISDFATAINESLGYSTVTEEDLMYPAVDLYGAQSWRNDRVNPFAGVANPIIPDSFSIDLSQFSYPLDEVQRVTSQYGYRRRFRRMHYGIDLKVQVGDTIRSAFDGRVRMVDYEGRGYGKYVVVRHINGLETVYGHCSKHLVKEGQIVRAGDPIALGGNTGRSTGSHLHFETRFMGMPINPEFLINFQSGVPKNDHYLFVKGKSAKYTNTGTSIAKRSGASNGSGIAIHKIRKGDTLSTIAQRYGTTVTKLCEINGISRNTTLQVGKTLRVNS